MGTASQIVRELRRILLVLCCCAQPNLSQTPLVDMDCPSGSVTPVSSQTTDLNVHLVSSVLTDIQGQLPALLHSTRWATLLLCISLSISDHFSKKFCWHTLRIVCNHMVIYPTTPLPLPLPAGRVTTKAATQRWGHFMGPVRNPDRPQGRQNLLGAFANLEEEKPMDITQGV